MPCSGGIALHLLQSKTMNSRKHMRRDVPDVRADEIVRCRAGERAALEQSRPQRESRWPRKIQSSEVLPARNSVHMRPVTGRISRTKSAAEPTSTDSMIAMIGGVKTSTPGHLIGNRAFSWWALRGLNPRLIPCEDVREPCAATTWQGYRCATVQGGAVAG